MQLQMRIKVLEKNYMGVRCAYYTACFHCVSVIVALFLVGQDHLLPEAEEIAMISAQLAARFLFSTGFHTKKVVRGPASDW